MCVCVYVCTATSNKKTLFAISVNVSRIHLQVSPMLVFSYILHISSVKNIYPLGSFRMGSILLSFSLLFKKVLAKKTEKCKDLPKLGTAHCRIMS